MTPRRISSRSITLVVTCALLVAGTEASAVDIDAISANAEVPEERLLDVGIQSFDPGFSDESAPKLEEKGIFRDVRKAESRYLPFELKRTLESTGHWGAVRVLPRGTEGMDVNVSGEILQSNGYEVKLRLRVADSTGRVWFDKEFKHRAKFEAYDREQLDSGDPYQPLYNHVANDMLVNWQAQKDKQLRNIREVTRLRFAADLAPESYGDCLRVKKKGRYSIKRLPSKSDPMMDRIANLRERDYMFVDTLNEYYADFSARMGESYFEWRSNSFEEAEALAELQRAARNRKIWGGLLVFAGLMSSDSGVSDLAVIGGALTYMSGMEKNKEAKMQKEALRELAASFDLDVAPLLVEVEGRTLRLEGSAEEQFDEWRTLLRKIFVAETNLPLDPDTGLPQPGPPPNR